MNAKLHISYSKSSLLEPGQLQLNQSKVNIWHCKLNPVAQMAWYPIMISWVPVCVCSPPPWLPSTAQEAYLIGSGWLHSTAATVHGRSHKFHPCPTSCGLQCNWVQPMASWTTSGILTCHMVPDFSSSLWPFKPSKHQVGDFYTLLSLAISLRLAISAIFWTTMSACDPKETLSRRFRLSDVGLRLITADTSAPVN